MYRHTQFGWVMLVSLLGTFAALAGVTAILPPPAPDPLRILPALLAALFLLFANLTVSVENEFIRLSFGIGLVRKKFRLADVKSAAPVRNPWLYGWGIHRTPRGWLFNVSGLDAVELEMKNGARYRIGTDEPEKLTQAIRDRLASV